MNYNLLEEKWIPVLWKDGNTSRVGIIEAFTQAGRIRQIATSNPMDRVAILRFLLALLYWCKGNPPDEVPNDSFPPDWFNKLHNNKDCFNLLGGGKKRFYQCKTESGKDEKLSANYLMQEVPTGTNFWHFRHSIDKINGLCPACCGMGLLRLPLFATSGGRGKPPGINGKPPIYVIPLGSSLADTLLFSWKVPDSVLGTPAWEKPNLQLPKEGEVPLLTGLTWLPRRVWLDNPEEIESNCISCGRKERLIRQCVFAGIGSTKTEDSQGRVWNDPHIICCDSKNVVKPGNALDVSDAAADQWAKITAGILRGEKADGKSRLWVVAFATVKNDKYLEVMEYVIPFPCTPEKVQKNIERFEVWRKEGSNLVRKVKPKAPSRKQTEISAMVASIRPHVEDRVSAKAAELIAGNDDAWEQAAREYSPMMDVIAKSLSPGYTTVAMQMRKQIAYVKPNMRPDSKAVKKPSLKKGENK